MRRDCPRILSHVSSALGQMSATAGESKAWIWIKWRDTEVIVEFIGGEGRRMQFICVTETPCNYGGTRKWFTYPSCSGQTSVLYGDPMFACQKCKGLRYQCQYQSPRERLRSKILKLRRKIGASDDMYESVNLPPAGMSSKAFMRNISQLGSLREALFLELEYPRAWAAR